MAGGSRLRTGPSDPGRTPDTVPGPDRALRCPGGPGNPSGSQSGSGTAAGGKTERTAQRGPGSHQCTADPEGPGRQKGGTAERGGQFCLRPGGRRSPGSPEGRDPLAGGAGNQLGHWGAGTFRHPGDASGTGPVLYGDHRPYPGRGGKRTGRSWLICRVPWYS